MENKEHYIEASTNEPIEGYIYIGYTETDNGNIYYHIRNDLALRIDEIANDYILDAEDIKHNTIYMDKDDSDVRYGQLKIQHKDNPIFAWTQKDMDNYMIEKGWLRMEDNVDFVNDKTVAVYRKRTESKEILKALEIFFDEMENDDENRQ